MSRRPLVATIVTTSIGALLGALFGALIGRIIFAVNGDPTIEASVPVAFCATLGFFVAGPAAAKGSLDRFGAARSSLGGAVAAAIIIVVFGYLNVGTSLGGPVLLPLAVLVTVIAAIGATAVGRPQEKPVPVPGAARPAPKTTADTQGGAIAAPFLVSDPEPVKPRASDAARRVSSKPDENWMDDLYEPQPMPLVDPVSGQELGGSPRRREPLRAVRPEPEPEPPAAAPADPPARPRRDRPLRRGDADSE